MNIIELKNDFKRACQMNLRGEILNSARLFLAVQRHAKRLRSRYAPDLTMNAHCFAVTALKRGKLKNLDHGALSELGRIKAASYFLLHGEHVKF